MIIQDATADLRAQLAEARAELAKLRERFAAVAGVEYTSDTDLEDAIRDGAGRCGGCGGEGSVGIDRGDGECDESETCEDCDGTGLQGYSALAAERDLQNGTIMRLEREAAQLRAEVERLRGELTEARKDRDMSANRLFAARTDIDARTRERDELARRLGEVEARGVVTRAEVIPHTACVRFTVPGHYGDQAVGGRAAWPDFAAAVAAARSTIKRFDYPGQTPDHTYSRAFVALRITGKGRDREALRWEVYSDRIVLVPSDQGGLSDEQAAATIADPAQGGAATTKEPTT